MRKRRKLFQFLFQRKLFVEERNAFLYLFHRFEFLFRRNHWVDVYAPILLGEPPALVAAAIYHEQRSLAECPVFCY